MSKRDLIVVGDIGGTNARFSLYPRKGRALRRDTLPSAEHASLTGALATFLGPDTKRVAAASLGIAGPVVDGRCRTTNLPWVADERAVARRLGIPRVTLLNDLVCVGLGAMAAPSKYVTVLQHRRPAARGGTVAVIAPGTGLGEAFFAWDGRRHVPCGTEGSHATFAPANERMWRLAGSLRKAYGHVSWERVASASSLHPLYAWLVASGEAKPGRGDARALASAADQNACVCEMALERRSPAAREALSLFVEALGAEAGNLALKTLSTGGVYVCGGLAGRLGADLEKLGFLQAFRRKGRMSRLLEAMPVAVVSDPTVGLSGALRHARSAL